MLSAVIFDFDGIIVDTEPIHYRAFQEVLQPLGYGYTWEEYIDRYIGFDDRDAFREAFRSKGKDIDRYVLSDLIEQKAQVFEKIVLKGLKPYPGVVPLIRSLSGQVPLGLCSGALTRDISPILAQLDIKDCFDTVVTADDVACSKPDPASYTLTLQRLAEVFPIKHLSPGNCLAIEDTPAGIASATGAGLRVLAVTNSYDADRLTGAMYVIDSLESTTLSTLNALFD